VISWKSTLQLIVSTLWVVWAWRQQFGVGTVEVDTPATLLMFLTSQTRRLPSIPCPLDFSLLSKFLWSSGYFRTKGPTAKTPINIICTSYHAKWVKYFLNKSKAIPISQLTAIVLHKLNRINAGTSRVTTSCQGSNLTANKTHLDITAPHWWQRLISKVRQFSEENSLGHKKDSVLFSTFHGCTYVHQVAVWASCSVLGGWRAACRRQWTTSAAICQWQNLCRSTDT